MKFNFRKIASALASTAMVGSTVALAAAANFPAPFVANGAADVAIVYGSTLDLGAVTGVSTALSSAMGGSSGNVTVSDEAYGLFTSSTPLQLNNSINSVRTSITESNLPSVLGDTSFSGDVDANVEFRITLGSNPRMVFDKIPTSNEDPTVGVSFGTSAGTYLYNATATFSKTMHFNHTDSEGEEITLFGQKFLVGSATDNTNLVLFKSAQKVSLSVGGSAPSPSSVVEVGGETYTVELTAATDTSATIKVTDSSGVSDQKEINEASSKKIRGLEVAVDIADESTATNVVSATVILGSEKFTFTDGSEVKKGADDTTVQGTKVDFNSGATADPGNLTSITLQVFAPDGSSDALRSGDEYVDPVFGSFRLAMKGLSVETDDVENRESIVIDKSGSDKMTLKFTDWNSDEKTVEWLNNESAAWTTAYLADSNDWRIFVQESAKINESAFAMVGNEETGYLVKLQSLVNTSGTVGTTSIYTSDTIKFQNVMDPTQTWTATVSAEGTGEVVIGGKTYAVTYWDDNNGGGNEYVQLNYPDSSGQDMIAYPTIQTSKGAKLMFYEPIAVNLSDWDNKRGNAWVNVSNIKIPDGDGYTSIAIAPAQNVQIQHNYSVTFSTLDDLNTNTTDSVDGLIGRLRWNISSGSSKFGSVTGAGNFSNLITNGTHSAVIMLEDNPDGTGTVIGSPAIVVFEEKDEGNTYEAMVIQTGGAGTSSSGTGVSDVDFTWDGDTDMGSGSTSWGSSGLQTERNDKLYEMMDQWGTLITTDQSDSDQYVATISYPDSQVTALLYVDSLATGSASTTLGNVKVLDDELATSGMQAKNLVVVGGSCVNTVASTLAAGNAGPLCGPSWTAASGAGTGEWIIQTFANPWSSSKVATLVAGWEQADTANAATYLTTQTTSTAVGTKLKGTTATTATVVTSGTAA